MSGVVVVVLPPPLLLPELAELPPLQPMTAIDIKSTAHRD
jgi:hypothetical protein